MTKISYEQQQAMGLVKGEQRTYIPAPQQQPQAQPPVTALVSVNPDKVTRDALQQQNDTLQTYLRTIAPKVQVLPADTGSSSAPRGYSSSSELEARNRRFFVTIGAMVTVAAMAMAGLVQIASAAGIVGADWQLPMWLGLTGIAALLIVRSVHGSEQRLSPEAIALNQQENDFAIGMKDAETRQLAIRYAARNDRERLLLERERNDLQREQQHAQTLEVRARIADQMAKHTTPQSQLNRLNNYRAQPQQPSQPGTQQGGWYGPDGPEWPVDSAAAVYEVADETAAIVDVVRQRLLSFTSDLYLNYKQDDQGRKVYGLIHSDGRLRKGVISPMSFRSDLTQEQRRQLDELLRQIVPRLFLYDEPSKTWTLNLRDYPKVFQAVDAIGSAYTVS